MDIVVIQQYGKTWVNLGEINSNYQTIEVTFLSTNTSRVKSICGNWEDGGGGISIHNGGNIYGEFYIKRGNTNIGYKGITLDERIEDNKIINICLTYNGEKVVLYVNGIEKGVNNTNTTGIISKTQNNTVFAIGTNPSGKNAGNNILSGKVYSTKIYNRALSEDEIHHNYILDKNRYGIEE